MPRRARPAGHNDAAGAGGSIPTSSVISLASRPPAAAGRWSTPDVVLDVALGPHTAHAGPSSLRSAKTANCCRPAGGPIGLTNRAVPGRAEAVGWSGDLHR